MASHDGFEEFLRLVDDQPCILCGIEEVIYASTRALISTIELEFCDRKIRLSQTGSPPRSPKNYVLQMFTETGVGSVAFLSHCERS